MKIRTGFNKSVFKQNIFFFYKTLRKIMRGKGNGQAAQHRVCKGVVCSSSVETISSPLVQLHYMREQRGNLLQHTRVHVWTLSRTT